MSDVNVRLLMRVGQIDEGDARTILNSYPDVVLPDDVAEAVEVAIGEVDRVVGPGDVQPAAERLFAGLGERAAGLRVVDTSCHLSASYAFAVLQDVDDDEPVGVGLNRTDEFWFVESVEGEDAAEESLLAFEIGMDGIPVIGDDEVDEDEDLDLWYGEPDRILFRDRVVGTALWTVALYALHRNLDVVHLPFPHLT